MNSQTLSSRADLEIAEVALRDLLVEDFNQETKGDVTSLNRMLVHLVNMHEALSTSPDRHINVAKRLGDFALTTTKIAGRHPQAAFKLTRLSAALRAASERLLAKLAAEPAADTSATLKSASFDLIASDARARAATGPAAKFSIRS
jgi:hypothetical protein